MVYRIFISTADDAESRQAVEVIQTALFRMNEFPISAITITDVMTRIADGNELEAARRAIETADVFIGLYGNTYGTLVEGQAISHGQWQYEYAHTRGLACLIFMPESARTTDNARLNAFRELLETRHIINYFQSPDDLQSKVILNISNFRKTNRHARKLRPPQQQFRTVGPQLVDDFSERVNRAWEIVEDDVEMVVRRALELHHATEQQQEAPDGWMRINPIFGQPLQQSQFQSDIFMITPFRANFDGIYQNIIRPTVAELNLTIKRGDDFTSVSGSIMQEVWAAINACQLVIVETTEVNANVYYELGIAHTLGKPAILITQLTDVEDLPFDIRHLRFIIYSDTIAGGEKLEADLRQAILWILNDLEERANDGDPTT